VYSFRHAEPLVVEQEISIAAALETSVQHKLLSVKQSWILQGGSNMTGTDLCVNKPHCAAAVRP